MNNTGRAYCGELPVSPSPRHARRLKRFPELDVRPEWQLIERNILPTVEMILLPPMAYRELLRNAAERGCIGGTIYDAIHLHAAQLAGCDRLYTFNVSDFQSLAQECWRLKIAAP